jgi:acyl-CoA hydrolase
MTLKSREVNQMVKTIVASETTMTQLVMPNDTNPLHNLMGGNLMKWMDTVAGICAGKHAEAHVVTAAVDHVSFHNAIAVGDVVSLKARVTRAFNTSVEVFVEVFANDIKGHNPRKSNHAYFTFVAIDDDTRKPIKMPGVRPLTDDEELKFESASRRRELRLILSGRMKPKDAHEVKDYFSKL